jgi:putative pyruvate formate lyase activating enzyme
MRRGVIIRHLVLPSLHKESIAAVDFLKKNFGKNFLLSLMAQYTVIPECTAPELNRRLTTYEYNAVASAAAALGIDGFIQDLKSARKDYIPDFSDGRDSLV